MSSYNKFDPNKDRPWDKPCRFSVGEKVAVRDYFDRGDRIVCLVLHVEPAHDDYEPFIQVSLPDGSIDWLGDSEAEPL